MSGVIWPWNTVALNSERFIVEPGPNAHEYVRCLVADRYGPKRHAREIPVPPGLAVILREMPTRIDSPWLFPTPSGKLWRYSNWHRKIWQETIIVAGIDPTPHECRHSWNSQLRAAGIDPAVLADVAGHSVEVATRVYTHPLRRSFDQIRTVVG
jgi:integrase